MATDHKEPNYMAVFFALFVLTVLEVGVVFLPVNKLIIGIALIVMALAKASLVALYFMHLKFEKLALGIIALTPLILCTLLIFSLLPDLTNENKVHSNAQVQAVEKVANAQDQVEERESN